MKGATMEQIDKYLAEMKVAMYKDVTNKAIAFNGSTTSSFC